MGKVVGWLVIIALCYYVGLPLLEFFWWLLVQLVFG